MGHKIREELEGGGYNGAIQSASASEYLSIGFTEDLPAFTSYCLWTTVNY